MTRLWLASSGTVGATSTAAAPTTLTWGQTVWALVIMGVVILLAGVLVIVARTQSRGRAPGDKKARSEKGRPQFEASASVVRSWIAISLVIGLLLFCALTFAVADTTLRSTLIGGLTASVGSAIAYYFSSKSAEQARQDLMSAHAAEIVPDLRGMPEDKAAGTLGKTSLRLVIDPTGSKDPTAIVESQHPDGGTSAAKGSPVQVTLSSSQADAGGVVPGQQPGQPPV